MYDERDDEMEAYMSQGDPRRCPYHPSEVISSPCGMFDGLCGACEYGYDEVLDGPQPEPKADTGCDDRYCPTCPAIDDDFLF